MKLRFLTVSLALGAAGMGTTGCGGGCAPIELGTEEPRADSYGQVEITANAKPALQRQGQIRVAVDGKATLRTATLNDTDMPEVEVEAPQALGAVVERGRIVLNPTAPSDGPLRLVEIDTGYLVASVPVEAVYVDRVELAVNAAPLGPLRPAPDEFSVLGGGPVSLVALIQDDTGGLLIDQSLEWRVSGAKRAGDRWDTFQLSTVSEADTDVELTRGGSTRTYRAQAASQVDALRKSEIFPHEWRQLVLGTLPDGPLGDDPLRRALRGLEVDPATRPDFEKLLEAQWHCYDAWTEDRPVYGVGWAFQPEGEVEILGRAGGCALLAPFETGALEASAAGTTLTVAAAHTE